MARSLSLNSRQEVGQAFLPDRVAARHLIRNNVPADVVDIGPNSSKLAGLNRLS
jgi:hypothetical protein